jgi:hypothetical protein
MSKLRDICIDLDRYYYYGRHDAVAATMQKLRMHLASTAKSKKMGNATGSRA